jgi:hypothetical protein
MVRSDTLLGSMRLWLNDAAGAAFLPRMDLKSGPYAPRLR